MHSVRKHNRLAEYNYSQPGAYFITVCVKDHKCILSTIVGGDAHIAPNASTIVGGDAHIAPNASTIVGADAYIGPYPKLTNLGNVVEKYLKTIPGIGPYVIMPNHVHMILHISATDVRQGPMWASAPTEASVPSLVRSWKTLVSKEVGRSIWQRSYYDHIIRDEQDYLIKAKYIAENPARWEKDDYYVIG
jgi:REP element-mobilizing transposase RayT